MTFPLLLATLFFVAFLEVVVAIVADDLVTTLGRVLLVVSLILF